MKYKSIPSSSSSDFFKINFNIGTQSIPLKVSRLEYKFTPDIHVRGYFGGDTQSIKIDVEKLPTWVRAYLDEKKEDYIRLIDKAKAKIIVPDIPKIVPQWDEIIEEIKQELSLIPSIGVGMKFQGQNYIWVYQGNDFFALFDKEITFQGQNFNPDSEFWIKRDKDTLLGYLVSKEISYDSLHEALSEKQKSLIVKKTNLEYILKECPKKDVDDFWDRRIENFNWVKKAFDDIKNN